jgi:mono/diheme cytochrome c family protein
MFVDEFLLARIPAPNLSTTLPGYSNEELARTLRHGISRDGRRMVIMPSSMYYHLSDGDLGAIIAWLRTVPPAPNNLGTRSIGLLGRLGLALGDFQVEPALIDHRAPRLSADTTDPLVRGEYLARTICTECHGPALEGEAEFTPHLGIVAGYTAAQFEHLMQTGEPIGGRELALMGEVARGRFVHLTGPERVALYEYLRTLAAAAARSEP